MRMIPDHHMESMDKPILFLAAQDQPVLEALPREPFLLETSMPGVFAAGDVRYGSVKRVASAVGEGSAAVQFVHQYLAEYEAADAVVTA